MNDTNVENVKFYRDGNRYIIVIEDPSEEFARAINDTIFSHLAIKARTVEDVVPQTRKTEPAPTLDGKKPLKARDDRLLDIKNPNEYRSQFGLYKNMTLEEAKTKYGTIVGIDFYNQVTHLLRSRTQKQIIVQVVRVIRDDLMNRDPDEDSVDTIITFFNSYKDALDDGIDQITNKYGIGGAEHFDDFIKDCDERVLRDAYSSLISFAIKKFKSV